jgi:hypothetical protein
MITRYKSKAFQGKHDQKIPSLDDLPICSACWIKLQEPRIKIMLDACNKIPNKIKKYTLMNLCLICYLIPKRLLLFACIEFIYFTQFK